MLKMPPPDALWDLPRSPLPPALGGFTSWWLMTIDFASLDSHGAVRT